MIGFAYIPSACAAVYIDLDKFTCKSVVTDKDKEAAVEYWSVEKDPDGRKRVLFVDHRYLDALSKQATVPAARIAVFGSPEELAQRKDLRIVDTAFRPPVINRGGLLATFNELLGLDEAIGFSGAPQKSEPEAAPSVSVEASPNRLRSLFADLLHSISDAALRQSLLVEFAKTLTGQTEDMVDVMSQAVRIGANKDLIRKIIRATDDKPALKLRKAYVLACREAPVDKVAAVVGANPDEFRFLCDILPPHRERAFLPFSPEVEELVAKWEAKKARRVSAPGSEK